MVILQVVQAELDARVGGNDRFIWKNVKIRNIFWKTIYHTMIQLKHFLHTIKPKVNFYSVTILKNNHMQMKYM